MKRIVRGTSAAVLQVKSHEEENWEETATTLRGREDVKQFGADISLGNRC